MDRAIFTRPKEGWGKGRAGWAIRRQTGELEHIPEGKILHPGEPGWDELTEAQQEWCILGHQRVLASCQRNKARVHGIQDAH
jgi:hypothetical protein